jgi:hypothetical protein
MFYSYAVTINANTAAASPKIQDLKLVAGVVVNVGIQFPAGCKGLAHCSLWHEGRQWLPTNPDEYFTADGNTIPIQERYNIPAGLNIVRFIGYNTDTLYSHTITIYINILPPEVADSSLYVYSALARFAQLIGA